MPRRPSARGAQAATSNSREKQQQAFGCTTRQPTLAFVFGSRDDPSLPKAGELRRRTFMLASTSMENEGSGESWRAGLAIAGKPVGRLTMKYYLRACVYAYHTIPYHDITHLDGAWSSTVRAAGRGQVHPSVGLPGLRERLNNKGGRQAATSEARQQTLSLQGKGVIFLAASATNDAEGGGRLRYAGASVLSLHEVSLLGSAELVKRNETKRHDATRNETKNDERATRRRQARR